MEKSHCSCQWALGMTSDGCQKKIVLFSKVEQVAVADWNTMLAFVIS